MKLFERLKNLNLKGRGRKSPPASQSFDMREEKEKEFEREKAFSMETKKIK
jgi:hypothetical protein